MPIHNESLADVPRSRGILVLRGIFTFASFMLCGYVLAQGFPGGGGGPGGGMHGGHGPPPPNGARPPMPQDAGKPFDPLEGLLRAAHEMRSNLVLSEAQMKSWGEMQADLRDVVDKRKALILKPTNTTQVSNPALLFVQDTAVAENALGQALEKLSTSMQRTFDGLDERQRDVFVQGMSNALNRDSLP